MVIYIFTLIEYIIVVGSVSGRSVMAENDFKKGDVLAYLDALWITPESANDRIKNFDTIGIHQLFTEMFLDVSVFQVILSRFFLYGESKLQGSNY